MTFLVRGPLKKTALLDLRGSTLALTYRTCARPIHLATRSQRLLEAKSQPLHSHSRRYETELARIVQPQRLWLVPTLDASTNVV